MTLKEINYTNIIKEGYKGLSIMQKGKCLAEGSFKEVLDSVPHLAECKVKEQRPYFSLWVVEIE